MQKTSSKQRRIRRNATSILAVTTFLVFCAMAIAMVASGYFKSGTAVSEPVYAGPATKTVPEPGVASTVTLPDDSDDGMEAHDAKHRGILVFVIDDVGHNTWQLESFLALPFPITLAVLPGLPYTTKTAEMVRHAGKELILHQPMEAIDALDPGPGAIRTDMDDNTIRAILQDNLRQVPGALGMNNHMGSKASSDVRVMSTVLDEVGSAGLYFLDSLTIADSVVQSVASLMRQSTWERTVFLDNTPDRVSMLHYIAEGTKVAEKRGYAIMIGHVWSAELAQTLADLYPQLVEQGFSLSTISRIMMDKDDDDGIGD